MGISKGWDVIIPAPRPRPIATSKLWLKQKRHFKRDANNVETRQRKGYVDAHDMNTAFIIPNTDGTGQSVALNMQLPGSIKMAKVMISHAWNEDIEQVLSILEAERNRRVLSDGTIFGDDTLLWFW